MRKKPKGAPLLDKRWLYIKDIVEDLGVHEETVRTWIKQKKLIAYRFGREYRIKPDDYHKFLENHRTDRENEDSE
jgi:excisionase family DNA binding protein